MSPCFRSLRSLIPFALCQGILLLCFAILKIQGTAAADAEVFFECYIQSDHSDRFQLFYDSGRGFNEEDSSTIMVVPGHSPSRVRFPVHAKSIHALRLDPGTRPGKVALQKTRFVCESLGYSKPIPVESIQATNEARISSGDESELVIEVTAEAGDPNLHIPIVATITLPSPSRFNPGTSFLLLATLASLIGGWLILRQDPIPRRRFVTASTSVRLFVTLLLFSALAYACGLATQAPVAIYLLLFLSLYCLFGILKPSLVGFYELAARKSRESPKAFIAAIAFSTCLFALGPVAFSERSLVSVDSNIVLVYGGHPTVPGIDKAPFVDVRGADIGAIFWQHIPYTQIQHNSLFHDGEIPWWNRHASCGIPLIGQGQSMFGDPLHWPFVMMGAEAWSLDLKFFLYRFIFVLGVGYVVLIGGGGTFGGALACLGSSALGFFNYRLNHPAIFSACLAPWVLYSWIHMARAIGTKRIWSATAILALSSLALLLSGTVKEAYVLSLALHLSGFAMLLLELRARRLFNPASLLPVALSALLAIAMFLPVALETIKSLSMAFTFSDIPQINLLPASCIPALFDDLLFRNLTSERYGMMPSMNLLLGFGILYCLLNPTLILRSHLVAVLTVSLTTAICLAHGVVPDAFLLRIPGIRNLGHIHNLGNCVSVVIGCILAGFGFSCLWQDLRYAPRKSSLRLWLGFAITLGLFLWYLRVNHPFWSGSHTQSWSECFDRNQSFYRYLGGELLALLILLISLTLCRSLQSWSALCSVSALCFVLLCLERHIGKSDGDLFHNVLGGRNRISLSSPALDWLKTATSKEPARVQGEGDNLISTTHALHHLESINGPDALLPRHYRELLDASGLVAPDDWRIHPSTTQLRAHLGFLAFLNVRYLVGMPDMDMEIPGTREALAADLQIREIENAWPRAFFTTNLVHYQSPGELVDILKRPGISPFAAIQTHDSASVGPRTLPTPAKEVCRAKNYRVSANETRFDIECPEPGIVVLQETWMPGDFVATIDGMDTPVLRVNHAFKGLQIEKAGHHEIRVTYRPRHAWWSSWVSISAFLACLLLLWQGLGQSFKSKPHSQT